MNDAYPSKFRLTIERKVRRAGIEIIFEDRIDTFPQPGSVGLTTRTGKVLPDADLVVSVILNHS